MAEHFTTMGGPEGRFPLTHWTMLQRAQSSAPEPERRRVLEELARAYWKPLYCFLRAGGRGNDDAKDLVQGFFGSFLERDVLAQFAPGRGRFRTFLLACLKGYVGHEREREQAQKRGGGKAKVSLDEMEEPDRQALPEAGETPELAYERAWAHAKLERAIERVRREAAAGADPKVAAVLEGYLASDNLARPGYAELSARSGFSENRVRHLLSSFRAKLRTAMLEDIRAESGSDEEAKEDLERLFSLLGRGAARS